MSETKISRRSFLKMGAMTAMGAALASCAPAAATTAPAEEAAAPTTAPAAEEGAKVAWWFAWSNLGAAVDKILASQEYKDAMGKDSVEYTPAVTAEQIQTAVAAGTPPDGGSNFDYPNFFYRGALSPVDDLVKASGIIKQEDILSGLWDSSFYDGKMIGVPGIEGFLWWGLNWNTKVAGESGLDSKAPPQTWEESLEWHKAMTKFDAAGNMMSFGLDPYDAMAGEPDFGVQSFGGFNWWDEKTRKINLNNDAVAEWFTTCGEFYKVVGPDKMAGMRQDQNLGTWGASFNAGVQNMIMEGYWHPGETMIQKPEVGEFNDATWAPVPAARKGAKIMATGAHFVVLFKDAKQPKGMFKFSEHLYSDSAHDIIFKEVGWVFGYLPWLKKADPTTYPGLKFYFDASEQVTEWIVGRRCPIHWFLTDQCTELREQVYRDNMSAKDAAAELQARAETEWSNQGLT